MGQPLAQFPTHFPIPTVIGPAEAQLDKTVRLESVKQADFDSVFYPGGHGPMWDIVDDRNSIKLIESFLGAGKPIAVVCHSTGALRHVKTPDGNFLVQGKEVTGLTNGEEEDVGLTKVVPFLVEDETLRLGAVFSKTANWGVHIVNDGLLITGQNPASLWGRREAASGETRQNEEVNEQRLMGRLLSPQFTVRRIDRHPRPNGNSRLLYQGCCRSRVRHLVSFLKKLFRPFRYSTAR